MAFLGFCASWFSPFLSHGLCAIFASFSRLIHLFQAPLDSGLDSPLLCQPLDSRFPGLHFTVYALSNKQLHKLRNHPSMLSLARTFSDLAEIPSLEEDHASTSAHEMVIPEKSPKSSADKMHRACALKATRTWHPPETNF